MTIPVVFLWRGGLRYFFRRRWSMTASAMVTPTVRPGSVFVAMHDPATNELTRWTIDPHSRQPAYKQSCVEVSVQK